MIPAEVTRRSVLAVAALPAQRPFGPVRVRFEEAHPHIVLPVRLDGRAGLALLDNGAPVTLVDPRLAGPGADLRRATLSIGEAQLRLAPLVQDLTHVANTAERPVRILLGMELFLRFVVGLDFVGKVMSLHNPLLFTPPAGTRRLGLRPLGYRKHTVEVTVGQAPPARAVIDLGSSVALLVSESFARQHRLTEGRATSHRLAPVFSAEGMVDKILESVRLDRVSFAGQSFRDVPIDILPADAGPFTGMDVVLGTPLMNRFALTFDLPRNRLYAAPSARLREPFVRRTVGISSEPEAAGLRVKHVAEGSPAETAGLKAGDLIVRIDGAPAGKRALRIAKPGQRLVLELAGGARRTIVAGYYY